MTERVWNSEASAEESLGLVSSQSRCPTKHRCNGLRRFRDDARIRPQADAPWRPKIERPGVLHVLLKIFIRKISIFGVAPILAPIVPKPYPPMLVIGLHRLDRVVS
jgi:hypothetical protein